MIPISKALSPAQIRARFANGGRSAKTSAYTVVAADCWRTIDCTSGTFTVDLTAAATLGDGFAVFIYNSGSGVITIDANGSEAIQFPTGSGTTQTLAQGQGVLLLCDGTGWKATAGTLSSVTAADVEVATRRSWMGF